MRLFLSLVVILTAVFQIGRAAAADAPMITAAVSTAPVSSDATLIVELVVNGRATGDIITLRTVGPAMLIEREALRRQGVLITGDGEINVAGTVGLTARYNSALQRLELVVSSDLLPINRVASHRTPRAQTVADVGALVNYDVYAASGDGSGWATVWSEQRAFGPLGVISNNGSVRVMSGDKSYMRYDTFARFVDEERAIAYTAGDFITQSLPWTRAVRMGGLQASRAFRVRPDLVTMPLPSFAGETAVPTAVDLFVNGYRQQSAEVAPGRFVLDNVPVVNGAGQATIVTTDAAGRQVSTVVPFYVSPTLLKPGLVDFSIEAGALRRGYGVSNFDYGPAAASASLRYGAGRTLTLEAHGEGTQRKTAGGAGFVWTPGQLGSISGSAAVSRAGGMSGTRWALGYEYASPRFSAAYQHEEQSAGFRDLGDVGPVSLSGARRLDRVVGSMNLGRQGSFALAYIGGETLRASPTRLATLSYQRPLPKGATLMVSADRDFKQKTSSAQLRVLVPLGRNMAGAAVSYADGRTRSEIDYTRQMPSHGGFGFDTAVAYDQRGDTYGQATLAYRNRNIELQTGGAIAQDQKTVWGSASGSLVAMDGGLFAANQVSTAFAVVDTGTPGVPVFYENQKVGKTDAKGRLFVANAAAYQSASFAIDTLSLPPDYLAPVVTTTAAVREGAGAIIELPVRLVRSIMAVLVDRAGRPLEPGAHVTRADGATASVGFDGLVYLEDVASQVELSVIRRDGSACRAQVDVPDGAAALAKIGPVACV